MATLSFVVSTVTHVSTSEVKLLEKRLIGAVSARPGKTMRRMGFMSRAFLSQNYKQMYILKNVRWLLSP